LVHAGFQGSVPFVTAVVYGYAYETVANKPIAAGQTQDAAENNPGSALSPPVPQATTLGLLAIGSPALPAWRREERE
jgi:hypothetical protein